MSQFMRTILYYENVLEFKENTGSPLLLREVHNLELCRLCLAHSDFASDGYRVVGLDGKLLKMEQMLASCTGVNIKVDDELPRHLCKRCVEQISTLYFFQLQAKRAQAVLKRLQQQLKSCQDEEQSETDMQEQPASEALECASVCDGEHSNVARSKCAAAVATYEPEKSYMKQKQELIEVAIVIAEDQNSATEPTEHTEQQEIEAEISGCINAHSAEQQEFVAKVNVATSIAATSDQQLSDAENSDEFKTLDEPNNNTSDSESTTIVWLEMEALSTADTSSKHADELAECVVEEYDLDEPLAEVTPCATKENAFSKKNSLKSRRARQTAAEHQRQRQNHICIYCLKEFKFKNKLMSHTLREHCKNKAFKCTECDTTYTHLQSLCRHRRTHYPTRERKVCEVCGKTFLRCDDWRRHMRIHTGERPYACGECDKAFKQINELKDHQRTHSTTKYECELCDARLSSRNGFYIHQKAHAGIKNYECGDCQKRFITNGELKSHMNVHLKSAKS